jgi:prophage tail gpP-like protein
MSSMPIPGKMYVVVEQDCLSRIARRAYGNAAQWPKLYKANVSTLKSKNPDLIYPGEKLWIPPETDALAPADPQVGRDPGEMTVICGGKELPINTGTLSTGIDLMASAWTIEMPWTPGLDADIDKATKRYSYAKAEIYLGNTRMARGKLYGVDPHATVDSRTKSLEFFCSTADLIDSTMKPPYEYKNKTLKQLASQIIGDLGYGFKFSCSPGATFDTISGDATDTYGDFFQKLATQRGILITDDEDENLVFLRAETSGKSIESFEEGKSPFPVEFGASFDGRARFGSYKALGQSGGADAIVATAKDPAVPGNRQITFKLDDVDSGSAANAAIHRRSKSLADALTIQFPVSDWYNSKGELYRKNSIVMVKSETLELDQFYPFVIRAVDYKYEPTARSAVLSICPPFALAGGEIQAPWA